MSSSAVTWTRGITESGSAQAVLVQRWVFIVVVGVVGLNEKVSCKQVCIKVSSARAALVKLVYVFLLVFQRRNSSLHPSPLSSYGKMCVNCQVLNVGIFEF